MSRIRPGLKPAPAAPSWLALSSVVVLASASAGCSDYAMTPEKVVQGLHGDLAAEPPSLDLPAVPLGERADAGFQLVNRGSFPVDLVDMQLVGGSGFSFMLPEQGSLGPGEAVDIPVAFSAGTLESDAVIEVLHASETGEQAVLQVPVHGTGLAGALVVEPVTVDFGIVPVDCVLEESVRLRNVGTAALEVHEVAVIGAAVSMGAGAWATSLAPGAEVELPLVFQPERLGAQEGELWVHHDGVSGVSTAPVFGESQPRARVEESFLQDGPWEAVDIIFAVDGSGSMEDDTDRLADNARAFFEALHELEVDARVSGVTRDDGCINGDPIPTREAAAVDEFARVLDGPWGVHTESLLTVAAHALEAGDGCNAGVFREGARTAVVVLSDEPDQSDDEWESYVGRLRAIDPHVVLSAIVGPAPDGCATAFPGWGYLEAAEATGGASLSLCSEDWGGFLELQAELVTGNPRTHFPLTEPAGPGEVVVMVDGEPAEGWTLDLATQELVFEDWAMPGPGAAIFVEYPAASECDPAP